MIVCIAEKPSVAREIARVLGATTQRQGYIEGNGYCVTWTLGHLCTLKEPDDYTPLWKRWSLGELPLIPPRFGIKLIDDPGYQRQFETIKQLVEKASMVINCGDAGQEGELIQQWVLSKALCKCPIKRLWVSSLTDEALKEGFESLKSNDDMRPLYEAGLARAIGDWLLGINGTRLYTLRYGQRGQVLSIGRVQTPTLALLVERQEQIENFESTTSFEIQTLYRGLTFRQVDDSFPDREKAERLLAQIQSVPLTIIDISKVAGKELPPRLFDLTSLQVEANKRFGMTAEATLQVIQSLYEKKVTSYPRVDTTYLPDDIYPKVPKILSNLKDYAHLTAPLLVGTPLKKSKKVFDNKKITDHHAIIPTGAPCPQLTESEKRIFDLIVRRFIAAFYPDAKTSTTTALAQIKDMEFKTSEKSLVEAGWRIVVHPPKEEASESETKKNEFGEPSPSEEEKKAILLSLKKGEQGSHEPSIREKTTEPPKYFTEATLLRAMETAGKFVEDENLREALKQNGIGRPSTRAAIIETLFKRNYIRREKNSLRATETGVQLIRTIENPLLKSAELTGIWENKLRQIERKEYEAATFLEELKEQVKELVVSVRSYRPASSPPAHN